MPWSLTMTARFLPLFSGLFVLGAQAATPLPDQAAVRTALLQGAAVRLVLDLGACQPALPATKPSQTRGGLQLGAFRITPDQVLAFADEHVSVAPDGQPVVQILRYRVKPDDSAEFSMDAFELPSYRPRGDKVVYRCAVNRGLTFYRD